MIKPEIETVEKMENICIAHILTNAKKWNDNILNEIKMKLKTKIMNLTNQFYVSLLKHMQDKNEMFLLNGPQIKLVEARSKLFLDLDAYIINGIELIGKENFNKLSNGVLQTKNNLIDNYNNVIQNPPIPPTTDESILHTLDDGQTVEYDSKSQKVTITHPLAPILTNTPQKLSNKNKNSKNKTNKKMGQHKSGYILSTGTHIEGVKWNDNGTINDISRFKIWQFITYNFENKATDSVYSVFKFVNNTIKMCMPTDILVQKYQNCVIGLLNISSFIVMKVAGRAHTYTPNSFLAVNIYYYASLGLHFDWIFNFADPITIRFNSSASLIFGKRTPGPNCTGYCAIIEVMQVEGDIFMMPSV